MNGFKTHTLPSRTTNGLLTYWALPRVSSDLTGVAKRKGGTALRRGGTALRKWGSASTDVCGVFQRSIVYYPRTYIGKRFRQRSRIHVVVVVVAVVVGVGDSVSVGVGDDGDVGGGGVVSLGGTVLMISRVVTPHRVVVIALGRCIAFGVDLASLIVVAVATDGHVFRHAQGSIVLTSCHRLCSIRSQGNRLLLHVVVEPALHDSCVVGEDRFRERAAQN